MENTQYQAENNVAPSDGEVGKLFRSAVRGFHRQDVTNYIERMARDRRRDAERYSAHIRSLEEERTQMTQELSHLRTQTAELNNEVFVMRNSWDEREMELTTLKSANAELSAANETLSAQVAELQEKLAEQAAVPMVDPAALARAEETLALRDQEIAALKAALDAAEKAQPSRDVDPSRRRSTVGSADLMNRVRSQKTAPQGEVADYRRRIERARQSAEAGIVESNSLYQEMRRNIARLEEILQSLND